jgi:hypothetical protein
MIHDRKIKVFMETLCTSTSLSPEVVQIRIGVHWIDVDDLSAQFRPLFQMVALVYEEIICIHPFSYK